MTVISDDVINISNGSARWANIASSMPALRAIIEELFPGQMSVEFDSDPEIPDCQYIVFNVTTAGGIKEIAARRGEWHRRSSAILADDSDKVRLLIAVE